MKRTTVPVPKRITFNECLCFVLMSFYIVLSTQILSISSNSGSNSSGMVAIEDQTVQNLTRK